MFFYQGDIVGYLKRIEFDNYTLKFGGDKVLLDLFDERLWPKSLGHYKRDISLWKKGAAEDQDFNNMFSKIL